LPLRLYRHPRAGQGRPDPRQPATAGQTTQGPRRAARPTGSKPSLMIAIPCPTPRPRASLGGLIGSSLSLAIAERVRQHAGAVLLVVPDTPTALRLEQEVSHLLADDPALPVHLFPDWETLPFDQFSPHRDILSRRL